MTESITRILVPVDFSAHSDRALRYAATLAGQVGASVEVLHVVEDFTYGAFSEVYVPNVPGLIQEAINSAVDRLTPLKAEVFPHGADVETVVYVGRPALTIVEHARTGKFDLIVMGTHGRTRAWRHGPGRARAGQPAGRPPSPESSHFLLSRVGRNPRQHAN